MHGTQGVGHRWLITVTDESSRGQLLRGFSHEGRALVVRKYDDVIKEEYQTFLRIRRDEEEEERKQREENDKESED